MTRFTEQKNNGALSRYLSPLAVWALAFGCSVGWGSFVMPGTTFLPEAGPWGSAVGLLIGAGVMMVFGVNYYSLMTRYPDSGGAYSYTRKVLGGDHGFLCAWMLILTYIAVIWANSTALSMIVRYIAGDVLCFGFSYQVAGYTVYFGEVLLSVVLLLVTCFICTLWKRIAAWTQIICALLMVVGVILSFVAVVSHRGGLEKLTPAFAQKSGPATQIFAIVILAPWAFIGFESISHSAEEFKFKPKKSMPIMIAALITGAMCYITLTLCAGLAVPDGFADWGEYIASLGNLKGLQGLPTFYAAREAMGDFGLVTMGIAAFCGIVTGLVGNYIALSRLIYKLSSDEMLPRRLSKLSRRGVPYVALLCVAGVSCVIPIFGRTAIGWIVDVTTIGATIVYSYTSISALITGKRERRASIMVWGIIGTLFAVMFAVFYLLPSIWEYSKLASESYLILIIWSLLGMVTFRFLIQRDRSRRLGKSEIVWVLLLVLILLVSIVWIRQSTVNEASKIADDVRVVHDMQAVKAGLSKDSEIVRGADNYITERIYEFGETVRHNTFVLATLILCSIAVIFSIFSIIKKREQQIESERLLAEQNSRAKSAFLSNMSHDLRTPMNAIIGYTELARREKDAPGQIRDYLEKIDYSGQHMLSLINDILDMSRIESGKMELMTEPADLSGILDEVKAVFAVQMNEKSIEFTVDYSDVRNKAVVCDKKCLKRILFNLVSNSYKFTPSGGRVAVLLRQTGGKDDVSDYELKVADTGIGMRPEFAEHVFDAFERERSRTVEGIQGSGLGMAITKRLVELAGGTISVDTEQGKGTCFTVCVSFPNADEKEIAEERADAPENETTNFAGKRLLLVEDNPINVEIALALLGAEGFEVDTAENGKVAVDIVASDPDAYDAILMDIQMPVMNGYDASRAIRVMGDKYEKIPIIALSANSFESDRRNALEAGMNAYVSKPYNPKELMATLEKLMN
ncbi:MAG: amino acid permease [Ruminococcus sp.]|nr:amino acid permease [Ruminococcus sp.]